jgi:SH3-like domain-containing protein
VKSRMLLIAFSLCVPLVHFGAAGAVGPSTPQQLGGAAFTHCDVKAYVIDRDPKGMNVRSGPSSSHKIIGNLPSRDVEGVSVHITGSKGDWVRIDIAVEEGGVQERTFFKGEGWLYGPLLGVDGIGGGTKLFLAPTERSRVVGNLSGGGEGGRVRGCQGKWMYIEHKKGKGWAAPGTLCANSLTTCV